MARLLNKLLCRIGWHDWKGYGGTVQSDTGHITLVWWSCKRCGEGKLKFIGR